MQSIERVDVIFKKMGMKRLLTNANYYTWKRSIYFIASIILYEMLTTSQFIFENNGHKTHVLQILVKHIGYLVQVTLTLIQFCILTIALKQRFGILCTALQMKIKESYTTYRYPTTEQPFLETIEVIAEQYKSLFRISKGINYVYSFPLFTRICLISVILLLHGHTIVYTFAFTEYVANTAIVLNVTQFAANAAIELVIIIKCSTDLCTQVNYNAIYFILLFKHILSLPLNLKK